MNVTTINRHRMRGLSLVETMVAVTISLILMGGAITLFINNKVTYEVNDNLSRLQENARFAINYMIQDLRMGGYFGCNNSSEKVTNTFVDAVPAETASLGATDNPLEGFDETLFTWSPSGDATPPIGTNPDDMVANTDAFTVRRLTGDNQVVIGSGLNSLTVDDSSGFDVDDQVAVSDCGGTDIFQIDTLAGDTMTPVGSLSREYDTNGDPDDPSNPIVSSFITIRYFVGNGANGPALYRQVIRNGLALPVQEIIEGVESMHIVYGVDSDGDNAPDTYVPAGDAALDSDTEWESVVSVRIAMLVRTIQQYGQDVDTNQYQLNDFTVNAANDRFKRRLFNTTVLLRNRLT